MLKIDHFYIRKFIKSQVELVGTNYFLAFIEFPTFGDAAGAKRLIDIFIRKLNFKTIDITFIGSHLHIRLMESIAIGKISDDLVNSSSRGYLVYTKNSSAFVVFLSLLSRSRLNFVMKEVIYPDQRSSEFFYMFNSSDSHKLFTSYELKKASVVAINNLYVGTLLPLLMHLKNK
jgi:hypothetical protein